MEPLGMGSALIETWLLWQAMGWMYHPEGCVLKLIEVLTRNHRLLQFSFKLTYLSRLLEVRSRGDRQITINALKSLPYQAWNIIFPIFSIYGIRPFHLSFAPFSTSHFKMAPTSTEDDSTASNQDGMIQPYTIFLLFENKTSLIFH